MKAQDAKHIDGEVDKFEFESRIQHLFAQVDPDGVGILTQQDLGGSPIFIGFIIGFLAVVVFRLSDVEKENRIDELIAKGAAQALV